MKILLAQHHNVRKKYLKGQGQNRSNLYINITPTKNTDHSLSVKQCIFL